MAKQSRKPTAGAKGSLTVAPPPRHEIDLGNPAPVKYVDDSSVDLFIRLEEVDPGDPGQLSGCNLRIMGGADCTYLMADFFVPQRDDSINGESHCLGRMDARGIARLLSANLMEGESVRLRMYSDYQGEFGAPGTPGILERFGGGDPKLAFCLGGHYFGMLCGALVTEFLVCARRRCELGRRVPKGEAA